MMTIWLRSTQRTKREHRKTMQARAKSSTLLPIDLYHNAEHGETGDDRTGYDTECE